MNICLPGDDYLPSFDGAVTSIRAYAKEFRKIGHRVYIPCPAYPDPKDPSKNYADNEPDIIRYVSRSAPFPPKYRLTFTWQTNVNWKDWNLDIVHSQSPFPLGYHGLTWARKLGIPALNTYHTLYPEYINTYINPVDPPGRVGHVATVAVDQVVLDGVVMRASLHHDAAHVAPDNGVVVHQVIARVEVERHAVHPDAFDIIVVDFGVPRVVEVWRLAAPLA